MRRSSLLLCLLLASCAGTVKNAPVPVEQAASELPRNRTFESTLRIEALTDYYESDSGKRIVGRDLFISAENPDRIRVTVSGFDKAAMTLVARDGFFSAIDLLQNKFYFGSSNAENLSKILPIRLSVEDFVRVLAGIEPSGCEENDSPLLWDGKKNNFVRECGTNERSQKIYYTYPDFDIAAIERFENGKMTMHYEAAEFVDEKPVRHPRKARFVVASNGSEIRIRIKKYTEGITFSSKVFVLTPPQGVDMIEIK